MVGSYYQDGHLYTDKAEAPDLGSWVATCGGDDRRRTYQDGLARRLAA